MTTQTQSPTWGLILAEMDRQKRRIAAGILREATDIHITADCVAFSLSSVWRRDIRARSYQVEAAVHHVCGPTRKVQINYTGDTKPMTSSKAKPKSSAVQIIRSLTEALKAEREKVTRLSAELAELREDTSLSDEIAKAQEVLKDESEAKPRNQTPHAGLGEWLDKLMEPATPKPPEPIAKPHGQRRQLADIPSAPTPERIRLLFCRRHQTFTAKDIAKALGISAAVASRHAVALIARGELSAKGARPIRYSRRKPTTKERRAAFVRICHKVLHAKTLRQLIESDRALSSADVASILDVLPSNVSTAMGDLLSIGAVRRVSKANHTYTIEPLPSFAGEFWADVLHGTQGAVTSDNEPKPKTKLKFKTPTPYFTLSEDIR